MSIRRLISPLAAATVAALMCGQAARNRARTESPPASSTWGCRSSSSALQTRNEPTSTSSAVEAPAAADIQYKHRDFGEFYAANGLLALMERKGTNPQYGDAYAQLLGALAQRIIPELETKDEPSLNHDNSTNQQIRRYRERK